MTTTAPNAAPLVLGAQTAADLMTRQPVSVRHDATIREAAAFLIEHEISAAPVVDDAGRALGVISHTDIVRHDARAEAPKPEGNEFYRAMNFGCPPALCDFIYGPKAESMRVQNVMSPVVIQVPTDEPAVSVVAKLLALKIHRLFVADAAGTLVGVISTFDVLRALHRQRA
jgi:CBS-domain-containing membrane protein